MDLLQVCNWIRIKALNGFDRWLSHQDGAHVRFWQRYALRLC
jgi:hypothetical protein